jgi:hypothetical protein
MRRRFICPQLTGGSKGWISMLEQIAKNLLVMMVPILFTIVVLVFRACRFAAAHNRAKELNAEKFTFATSLYFAAKYKGSYYLPTRAGKWAYIVALIMVPAILAAPPSPSKVVLVAVFGCLPIFLCFSPSARLIYRSDEMYFYSDDTFTKNTQIEKPKCVREGKYAVLIFKTIAPKPKLIQFNIPVEAAKSLASFFDGQTDADLQNEYLCRYPF